MSLRFTVRMERCLRIGGRRGSALPFEVILGAAKRVKTEAPRPMQRPLWQLLGTEGMAMAMEGKGENWGEISKMSLPGLGMSWVWRCRK